MTNINTDSATAKIMTQEQEMAEYARQLPGTYGHQLATMPVNIPGEVQGRMIHPPVIPLVVIPINEYPANEVMGRTWDCLVVGVTEDQSEYRAQGRILRVSENELRRGTPITATFAETDTTV